MKTRLILTDDHLVLRQGLRALLDAQPDLEVIGEAGDGEKTLELVRTLRPDVVLVDLIMPGVDGITTTQHIHHDFPDASVLVLSSIDEEAAVLAAVRAGVMGYVQRNTS
jgi:DNA-binding NarL/FixJ family response regulator